jgi:hypothetical protein
MTNIDESLTAKGYTPAALVPATFGQARTIEGCVIHHWGDRGQTHDGVVNFFVNGPGATSAHFVVSAGRITCLVNPADAAWHCPGKNATTIGIECRPEATDADYATVAELVRYLRAQYGHLPLSMHRDWYATACPGVWDLARIDTLASGAASQGGTIAPAGELANTSTPTQEDDLSAEFERDVRAQLASDAGKFAALDRDLRAQLQGLPSLDRDVRADLAQKGRQIAALTSTTEALAGLVGREQGLDIETIKQAVTEAIAAGLTVTVEVK